MGARGGTLGRPGPEAAPTDNKAIYHPSRNCTHSSPLAALRQSSVSVTKLMVFPILRMETIATVVTNHGLGLLKKKFGKDLFENVDPKFNAPQKHSPWWIVRKCEFTNTIKIERGFVFSSFLHRTAS